MKIRNKIRWYKILCVLFAFAVMLMPQHGMMYTDIRVLAAVLGVDGAKGDVTVSAQLTVPVAQESSTKGSMVAKAKGGCIAEALENLEIELGRHIDYGHLTTVAIGKEMSTGDIKDYLGYLLSCGKAGPGCYLLHCPNSYAWEFLEGAQQIGDSTDAELDDYLAFSKSGNHVAAVQLLRFLQGLNSASYAAPMPCVRLQDASEAGESADGKGGKKGGSCGEGGDAGEISSGSAKGDEQAAKEQEDEKKKEEQSQSGESSGQSESGGDQSGGDGGGQSGGSGGQSGGSGGQSGGSGGQSGGGEKKLVAIDTISVFGGEKNEAAMLGTVATRGFVWQDATSDFGLIELRNAEIDGRKIHSVPARLHGKKVSRHVTRENGEIVVTFRIRVTMRLEDAHVLGSTVDSMQTRRALQGEFESRIRSDFDEAVSESKATGIDFLGLRELCHRYDRAALREFDLSTVVVRAAPVVKIES